MLPFFVFLIVVIFAGFGLFFFGKLFIYLTKSTEKSFYEYMFGHNHKSLKVNKFKYLK
jgi:uncharacterized membrane protein